MKMMPHLDFALPQIKIDEANDEVETLRLHKQSDEISDGEE